MFRTNDFDQHQQPDTTVRNTVRNTEQYTKTKAQSSSFRVSDERSLLGENHNNPSVQPVQQFQAATIHYEPTSDLELTWTKCAGEVIMGLELREELSYLGTRTISIYEVAVVHTPVLVCSPNERCTLRSAPAPAPPYFQRHRLRLYIAGTCSVGQRKTCATASLFSTAVCISHISSFSMTLEVSSKYGRYNT